VINGPLHNGDFIGRHFYHPAGGILKRQKILYDKITYVKPQFIMTGAIG